MHPTPMRTDDAMSPPERRPADWRLAARLIAAAALFGAIIGSIGGV
jgi:hypothetical protein